jgi:transcriptional regulator with XRE-family HTH domain
MNIGENIQKIRKSQNLTQDELARKAGIPYTTIAKIESGMVKNPTIMTLVKLAKALKVSLDDFVINLA